MLASALNRHPDLRVAGETFVRPKRFGLGDRSLIGVGDDATLHTHLVGTLAKYDGFIAHREHRALWPVIAKVPELRVLFLIRRNFLKQLVSREMGWKTSVWHLAEPEADYLSDDGGSTMPPLQTLRLEEDYCLQFFNRMRAEATSTLGALRNHQIFPVFFEDLVSNWTEWLAAILDFLSVPQHPLVPETRQQELRPLEQILDNFSELRACFAGGPWASFFDDQESAGIACERGVLTIATGPAIYRECAIALARTLELRSPTISRAVITDRFDPMLDNVFDHVISLRPEHDDRFLPKLHLLEYSPFGETLFIDADSLVLRDVTEVFDAFAAWDFNMIGVTVTRGNWYGDVAAIIKQFGLEWLPKFNSGLIYFRRTIRSTSMFRETQLLFDAYEALRLKPLNGHRADEPVFAIAMGRRRIRPLLDGGRIMRTTLGADPTSFDVDAIMGDSSFVVWGETVRPAVVHLTADWRVHPVYERERTRLAELLPETR